MTHKSSAKHIIACYRKHEHYFPPSVASDKLPRQVWIPPSHRQPAFVFCLWGRSTLVPFLFAAIFPAEQESRNLISQFWNQKCGIRIWHTGNVWCIHRPSPEVGPRREVSPRHFFSRTEHTILALIFSICHWRSWPLPPSLGPNMLSYPPPKSACSPKLDTCPGQLPLSSNFSTHLPIPILTPALSTDWHQSIPSPHI